MAAIRDAIEDAYKRGFAEGSRAEWKRGSSAIRAEVTRLKQDADAVARGLRSLEQAIEMISREADKCHPHA